VFVGHTPVAPLRLASVNWTDVENTKTITKKQINATSSDPGMSPELDCFSTDSVQTVVLVVVSCCTSWLQLA
jgi:hypothetical protein